MALDYFDHHIEKPSWRQRKARLLIVALFPFWAILMVCYAVFVTFSAIPFLSMFSFFGLLLLLIPGYWIMLAFAGAASDAADGQVVLKGDTITLSVTQHPIKSPRVRRIYKMQWQEVAKVEAVFEPPFFGVTQIRSKTGEVFLRSPTSNWSNFVSEAKRRGLYEETRNHAYHGEVIRI